MSTDVPLPLQLSSSWTWSPADPSTDDPYFEKMASQGQSFFQAAGDSAAYRGNAPWPANSAYVITVGGTDLETQSAGGPWLSETVLVGWWWRLGDQMLRSPPGRSPQPMIAIRSGGDCSKTDRDAPTSRQREFYFYVCADQTTCTANYYGGTSFAAPMWAGYLALTNQQATANGDPAPGFINSTIYPLNLAKQ